MCRRAVWDGGVFVIGEEREGGCFESTMEGENIWREATAGPPQEKNALEMKWDNIRLIKILTKPSITISTRWFSISKKVVPVGFWI